MVLSTEYSSESSTMNDGNAPKPRITRNCALVTTGCTFFATARITHASAYLAREESKEREREEKKESVKNEWRAGKEQHYSRRTYGAIEPGVCQKNALPTRFSLFSPAADPSADLTALSG